MGTEAFEVTLRSPISQECRRVLVETSGEAQEAALAWCRATIPVPDLRERGHHGVARHALVWRVVDNKLMALYYRVLSSQPSYWVEKLGSCCTWMGEDLLRIIYGNAVRRRP